MTTTDNISIRARVAELERAADLTWFWAIVDRDGLGDVSSDERVALRELVERASRYEVVRAQLATAVEALSSVVSEVLTARGNDATVELADEVANIANRALFVLSQPTAPAGEHTTRDSSAPGEWRDISTAPKDGTSILYRTREGHIGVCTWWSAERWAEYDGGEPEEYLEGWYDDDDGEACPVEWAPLPAPSSETAPREGE